MSTFFKKSGLFEFYNEIQKTWTTLVLDGVWAADHEATGELRVMLTGGYVDIIEPVAIEAFLEALAEHQTLKYAPLVTVEQESAFNASAISDLANVSTPCASAQRVFDDAVHAMAETRARMQASVDGLASLRSSQAAGSAETTSEHRFTLTHIMGMNHLDSYCKPIIDAIASGYEAAQVGKPRRSGAPKDMTVRAVLWLAGHDQHSAGLASSHAAELRQTTGNLIAAEKELHRVTKLLGEHMRLASIVRGASSALTTGLESLDMKD
jgi:hypothetical protein